MLTQSKEVQNAWRASQRTLDIKVTIDGKTYGATDINSLKYDSGAYNGDTFAIGSTYSNTVQIEFSHLIEGLKLGMEVHPSIGIKTSSSYVYEPLGVFIISSEIKMDRNNNLTTVSASDRFCGLEGTYVSKLTYPAKVLDVIAEICAQSGVKANTDDLARLPHQADLPAPITGQSYRKALGWIAQLYVGYALFDRQGLFTIRTISEPNYELDPSQYEQAGLTKNEAAYKINGIQCQVTLTTKTRDGESTEETKTYQAGDATGSQIKLENNIMTPQRLNDIWEQLKDLTFYPFSLNWFGNPAVEAGDWLRLEDKQRNSFVVPNSSYTLDFNGGLSATSKADQTTSSDQMVPWQGSVAQTIKELQLRRLPDGTVVFPPSVTAPPTNAKFNDVWFKKNGNSTELWIFEKQDDGSGKWIRKDLSDDEIKKKVADAQQGLNQAKADIINNKQKADTDIENLNKSIEANKKVADESLQKLNDSVTNLQGQYDNNIVPNLNKVMADASDALQKYISAQNSIADLAKRAQEQGKNIANVTNTVKGLNVNYANLAGDVNSTKVDVKGLQTTIGTANGDIAQLKLDAQNLQTMLAGKVDNTTYTNFVNLTNQALNVRLTASDLNGYAKTTDVQATANGLKFNIDSVTDRMNNLKVGGRNLIPNSGTDIVIESKTTDPYPARDNKAVYWNLTPGETYTFSVSATNTNGVEQASVRIFKESLDGKFINKEAAHWYFNADGKRRNFTFTTPNDAIPYDIWLYAGPMGTLQGKDFTTTYHHPQLEVGTVATDYRPAPEDVANDITQLSARITANSQQFSSYYTKSETNTKTNIAKNDAVNAIKSDSNWTGLKNVLTNSGFLQTADGFLQKVQQTTVPMFNGGGVNLLLNTQNFDHNWAWDNIDHSYAKGVLTL
ncbi:peptidase, partial [Limosilactobacillus caviae]|nr:peptidase [Limosilactobacillus caviae]